MKVAVTRSPDGKLDLVLDGLVAVTELSEHGLRDIGFVLAQYLAMTARCDDVTGEHTCGLSPSHRDARVVVHMCRACDVLWDADGNPRRL